MPLDRQIRLGTGLQYNWNQNVTLGAAYTHVDLKDAKIDQTDGPRQGTLKGHYKRDNMHVAALNLIWRF